MARDETDDAHARLVALLRAQRQLHGTGRIGVGGGAIFLVFGHPLHATMGDAVGLEAISAIGLRAAAESTLAVEWQPEGSGGSRHSLRPTDDIERWLAPRVEPRLTDRPLAREPEAEDLPSMRARLARGDEDELRRAAAADAWADVARAICELLGAGLHRHSRELTDLISAADLSAAGLGAAISDARKLVVRAVSPSVQAALLDEAERLVAAQA